MSSRYLIRCYYGMIHVPVRSRRVCSLIGPVFRRHISCKADRNYRITYWWMEMSPFTEAGGGGAGADGCVWRQDFDLDGILMSFSANLLDRASLIMSWSKDS